MSGRSRSTPPDAPGDEPDRGEASGASNAEALLAAIVSSSDDAIVSKTLEGRITSWNAGAERLFGYSAAEAIGQSILLIVPPDKRDEESGILERIGRGERVDHFETVRHARGGRRVEVSLTISPVRDRQGRIVGASKVARDITARKAAEAAVRSSQELLRLIVDNVPALISYIDREYVYRLNNRAYETWFDQPVPDMTGRHVPDVLGAAAWEKLRPYMEAALAGERVSYEELVPYEHGGARWIDATYVPHLAADGSVQGFAVFVNDVSERRRIEEAQRLLVALHDATRGLDDPGEVMRQITTGVGRHFGVIRCAYGELAPGEEKASITRGYTDGVPTVAGVYELERFGTGVVEDLRAGRTVVVRDVLEDPRTRTPLALATYTAMEVRSLVCAPILKGGQPLAFLVMADRDPRPWDPHDAGLLEQVAARTFFAIEGARAAAALRASRDELGRLNAELSENDRRKDEFLAVLAHELRNPLAPIRSAVQYLLLRDEPDPAARNAREIIDRQVRHLVRLVDDLLDVSRIRLGKIDLQKERVGLDAILTHALEASRPLIEAEGHRLTVSAPPEPIHVDADLTRLAQVLQNLLNNAARYTPPGGHVELSAAREGGELVLRVRDDGAGIPPDMLTRVFEPFAQLEPSIGRTTGGLGIGLTLAKRLVELHGGRVEAHSAGLERGSEFVVRLPAPAQPLSAAPSRRDAE
ncbi:MAG TPA: PAS domain S-box protein, partial [Myxococcota bacterium]|nr:PAS domain S-box protein [Myxococcota bacterium]